MEVEEEEEINSDTHVEFEFNQQPETPDGLIPKETPLNWDCRMNFDEIDESTIEFIGGGTSGSVFSAIWNVHGDKGNRKHVVVRVEFFQYSEDLNDPNYSAYQDIYIHHRMNKLLLTGALPGVTELYAYVRCAFPFGTKFANGIFACSL